MSGYGSGALSKGLIGNGMLSELKLFRSGLSMLLFEYGSVTNHNLIEDDAK